MEFSRYPSKKVVVKIGQVYLIWFNIYLVKRNVHQACLIRHCSVHILRCVALRLLTTTQHQRQDEQRHRWRHEADPIYVTRMCKHRRWRHWWRRAAGLVDVTCVCIYSKHEEIKTTSNYSAPVGQRSFVINPSVCVSVCLSASISLELLDRSSRNVVCSSPDCMLQ